MNGGTLRARWLTGIDAIDAASWNALAGEHPFTRHEFLAALERSGCATPDTGWSPQHLAVYDGTELVALAPAWLKAHSWGEFVFDFAWARAYSDAGGNYYPKLLLAAPFTPATGARVLTHPQRDGAQLTAAALRAAVERACELGLSSVHALFLDAATAAACDAQGWLARSDCQFHWHNAGYRDFDDYLATFTAERRKKVRRERRRVAEQGISFRTLTGAELDPPTLHAVWQFHAATFAAHGHEPYLSVECLRQLAATMGARLLVKLALRAAEPVGAAIFFRSDRTLYGRYWGASGQYHSLHFEACYYQGIELCLQLGLQSFEPGTQGEHKLARGFAPTLMHSAHWIADPRFRQAIAAWLRRERRAVDEYAAAAAAHLPFHE